MNENTLKVSVTGIGAILTYISGNLTPMIFILVLFEVMDYVSGIVSSAKKGNLSSAEAMWGFAKKVFYFFVVAVAFCFDYVVYEVELSLGFNFDWPAVFGVLSVCYLISTEAISILENLAEMDITVPFLSNAIKVFKEKIEDKGENKG